jgi:riboflavin kinase
MKPENNTIELFGRVFSGKGEGRLFTSLPWVRHQIREKLGFHPYPGTLNLEVNLANAHLKLQFRRVTQAEGIEICDHSRTKKGKLFKALLMKRVSAALIRPEVPNYPPKHLEIISAENLRETLNLKDNDMVELKIWIK